ncbi:hypothetical protein NX862_10685 [Rhodobacter sp. KR11]|uniref:hypothetical protein n=1 Tax=Rhodobacter sp. KR11 TaxID=2974588 RepID=UPI00222199D6|nr:hypothetical protein [Rhodobacter sp. KR11]MCW1919224.1 hypothetical protein [Rhodobacter sp. KR11]
MARHLFVLTFLEWLAWCGKGELRVAPGRLVWAAPDHEAVRCSLSFAPDLEPADDGFLLAEVILPPRVAEAGQVWLSFEGARFEALSERSFRLLCSAAERMHIPFHLASADVQAVWSAWKDNHRVETAHLQARRLWCWALGADWPAGKSTPEVASLGRASGLWEEMTALLSSEADLRVKIAGTSMAAWIPMVRMAEKQGLLPQGETAPWRPATRPYFNASCAARRPAPHFIAWQDPLCHEALDALPLDHGAMVELMAVATGAHHALRVSSGQEPDIAAWTEDLQNLQAMAKKAKGFEARQALTLALVSLGQLLPQSAVAALVAQGKVPAGWAVASPVPQRHATNPKGTPQPAAPAEAEATETAMGRLSCEAPPSLVLESEVPAARKGSTKVKGPGRRSVVTASDPSMLQGTAPGTETSDP